ncbi:hypothetical protein Tco_0945562 [Tanacetum coccineum]
MAQLSSQSKGEDRSIVSEEEELHLRSQQESLTCGYSLNKPLSCYEEFETVMSFGITEGSMPNIFKIGQSSSLYKHSDLVSPSSPAVPTPVASPADSSPVALPAMVEAESFLAELRSLEKDQERATVTFGAIWRSVLALESWAGHVDVQRAEMWQARYDDHRLIHDLLVQNTMMQRELQEL